MNEREFEVMCDNAAAIIELLQHQTALLHKIADQLESISYSSTITKNSALMLERKARGERY